MPAVLFLSHFPRPNVSLVHSPPQSRIVAWQLPAWELFFGSGDALPSFSYTITARMVEMGRRALVVGGFDDRGQCRDGRYKRR